MSKDACSQAPFDEPVILCSSELHCVIVSVAQDKLKEQGGKYSKVDCVLRPLSLVCIALLGISANISMAADVQGADWSPYVVTDGRLVTGQNPQSSEKMALEVVKLVKASG